MPPTMGQLSEKPLVLAAGAVDDPGAGAKRPAPADTPWLDVDVKLPSSADAGRVVNLELTSMAACSDDVGGTTMRVVTAYRGSPACRRRPPGVGMGGTLTPGATTTTFTGSERDTARTSPVAKSVISDTSTWLGGTPRLAARLKRMSFSSRTSPTTGNDNDDPASSSVYWNTPLAGMGGSAVSPAGNTAPGNSDGTGSGLPAIQPTAPGTLGAAEGDTIAPPPPPLPGAGVVEGDTLVQGHPIVAGLKAGGSTRPLHCDNSAMHCRAVVSTRAAVAEVVFSWPRQLLACQARSSLTTMQVRSSAEHWLSSAVAWFKLSTLPVTKPATAEHEDSCSCSAAMRLVALPRAAA